MEEALLVSILISFFTTYLMTPKIIRFLKDVEIVAVDLHKKNKPRLPASGGICVSLGILAGILCYVGIQTFVYGLQVISIQLLAVVSSTLMVTLSGLFDDLIVRSKAVKTKDGINIKIGFSQWVKPLLTLPAAIPLMVIAAGVTTMSIPFIGDVDFGILYPFIIVPIGFVGASNVVNLLGGFNGLETGMGIIYSLSLGIFALLHRNVASVLLLTTSVALLAFLKYNWYPAKILPGDSLTYLLGSIVAAGVVIGDMNKAGLIVMTPFIIEFALKARSKFKASCLGRLRTDGSLDSPYKRKIYSWTHIIMNFGRFTERGVTIALIFVQIFFAILPFLGII